jgi:hypothetical protein
MVIIDRIGNLLIDSAEIVVNRGFSVADFGIKKAQGRVDNMNKNVVSILDFGKAEINDFTGDIVKVVINFIGGR